MKEFNHISTFKSYINNLPTLHLTVDATINKTFTIYRCDKFTMPTDLIIDWGDGDTTKYDDLAPSTGVNTNQSVVHTYKESKLYNIVMSGSIKQNMISCTFRYNDILDIKGTLFFYMKDIGIVDPRYLNVIFADCTKLTTIDKNLFKLCTDIQTIRGIFNGCTALTNVPKTLFDNCSKIRNCRNTFANCPNITTDIPELWNKDKWPLITTDFVGYAYKCTKAANYADIPNNWKNTLSS